MLVDRLERWVLATAHAALTARALGAQVDVPDWAEAKARFDELLAADPVRATSEWDSDRSVLLAAVGLRR